jgi:hypothetical protein
VHVDALLASAAAAVAQPLAPAMGRRKRSLALAANLASISLPD